MQDRIKSTVFLGLFNRGGLKKISRRELSGLGEIWTMNDWYHFYPALKNPDRIFNIHPDFRKHASDSSRFPGDWISKYKESGAIVYLNTNTRVPGLKNARIYPFQEAQKRFGSSFFTSTLSAMFALAAIEGFRKIALRGFHMLGPGEYEKQLPGVLHAAETLERTGIEIDMPLREKWEDALKRKKVQWKSLPAYKPYWENGIAAQIDSSVDTSLTYDLKGKEF